MNESSLEPFATRVRNVASTFDYPPTPDLAVQMHAQREQPRRFPASTRRLAYGVTLAVLLCLLAAVSILPVRAALLRLLPIGAIQVYVTDLLPSDPTEFRPVSITDLGEPINASEAAELITLRSPAYPPSLGEPDAIYGQNLLFREPVVSFQWHETADRPQITLTQIEIADFAFKWASGDQVATTEVDGQAAVWIEGPHLFDLVDGRTDRGSTIATSVLIWSDDALTYRLEGELSQSQAVAIAETWR